MRRFVLLGAVSLAGCARGPVPVTGVKVDSALATLIPADTVLMAGARVEALEKTPLAGINFQPLDDFARQTGVDPRKDLRELLFVSNGKQGVLLGRGKFAASDRSSLITPDKPTTVAFIDSRTAVVGETFAVKSVLERRGNSHGPPAALAALMKDIPPESQIWAVYTGSPFHLNFGGNVNKVLGSLESGSLYFDLRAGLNGVATGLCSNEQAAQDVEGALKVLIGIGRLNTPSNQPDMLRLYDGLHITRAARRVTVSIDEPPDLVKRSLDLLMKQ